MCLIPGTVQGTEPTMMNKKDKILPCEACMLVKEADSKKVNMTPSCGS